MRRKKKLVKIGKKKVASICHRFSIFEIGNIETRNSIKYLSEIVDWVCFKTYEFDKTQPLSVQQVCDLLVKYYCCSKLKELYRKSHQIDLFLSEACVINEQKLKHNDRAFNRNGIYQDIFEFIQINKTNHYCYIYHE